MKKPIQFIVVVILLSFIATVVVNVNAANNALPEEDLGCNLVPYGTQGMDWTLKEILSDQTMSFSSFAGKVVLLEFFETTCGPCSTFLIELRQVRAQFSSNELIMISVDTNPLESEAEIEAYAEEQEIDWYIFSDTAAIQTFYEIVQIPTFYIFNSDQKVVYSNAIITDAEVIISEINKHVGGVQTTTNPNGDPIPDFWASNWYWFVIGGVLIIITVSVTIQRVRVVNHNKKMHQQKTEERQRKYNKRYR